MDKCVSSVLRDRVRFTCFSVKRSISGSQADDLLTPTAVQRTKLYPQHSRKLEGNIPKVQRSFILFMQLTQVPTLVSVYSFTLT